MSPFSKLIFRHIKTYQRRVLKTENGKKNFSTLMLQRTGRELGVLWFSLDSFILHIDCKSEEWIYTL